MKILNNNDGSITFSRTLNSIDYSLTIEGVSAKNGRKMFAAFVRECDAIIRESNQRAKLLACLTCREDSTQCKGDDKCAKTHLREVRDE